MTATKAEAPSIEQVRADLERVRDELDEAQGERDQLAQRLDQVRSREARCREALTWALGALSTVAQHPVPDWIDQLVTSGETGS